MSRRSLARGTKGVSSDADASDGGNDDGGRTNEEAFRKLAEGEFVFPTLSGALEMLGMDGNGAGRAAAELRECRARGKRTTREFALYYMSRTGCRPSPLVRSGSVPLIIPVDNGPRFPPPVG